MTKEDTPFRVALVSRMTGTQITAFVVWVPSENHARSMGAKQLAEGGFNLSPAYTHMTVTPVAPGESGPARDRP